MILDSAYCPTYICARQTKQTLSAVVGLGHGLTILQLLSYKFHLIGHFVSVIHVSVPGQPSNQLLQTEYQQSNVKLLS